VGNKMKQKDHKDNKHSLTRQKQKENLKILVENSSVGKVRSAGRIMKYGAASFKRNIWLSIAATLVMTITLIIILVTIGASLVLSSTAEAMREKIDITIYLRPETSQETLDELANLVKSDENVKHVEVSDSAHEYQLYLEESQENTDLIEVLADPTMSEIMLSTMRAIMRIKVHNPDDISNLKSIVADSELFQASLDPDKEPSYDENREAIEKISSWANIAKNGGLILGAVFLVISILMIFNTIRMAIFSRREEIYMMRLVGADTSFIRGPFLVEAEISGVISGILASTAAYAIYRFLVPGLTSSGIDIITVELFMGTNRLVLVYLLTVVAGVVIGNISARLAMQKYLK